MIVRHLLQVCTLRCKAIAIGMSILKIVMPYRTFELAASTFSTLINGTALQCLVQNSVVLLLDAVYD